MNSRIVNGKEINISKTYQSPPPPVLPPLYIDPELPVAPAPGAELVVLGVVTAVTLQNLENHPAMELMPLASPGQALSHTPEAAVEKAATLPLAQKHSP